MATKASETNSAVSVQPIIYLIRNRFFPAGFSARTSTSIGISVPRGTCLGSKARRAYHLLIFV